MAIDSRVDDYARVEGRSGGDVWRNGSVYWIDMLKLITSCILKRMSDNEGCEWRYIVNKYGLVEGRRRGRCVAQR